eukprot:3935266-Rhodomonas_salina.1
MHVEICYGCAVGEEVAEGDGVGIEPTEGGGDKGEEGEGLGLVVVVVDPVLVVDPILELPGLGQCCPGVVAEDHYWHTQRHWQLEELSSTEAASLGSVEKNLASDYMKTSRAPAIAAVRRSYVYHDDVFMATDAEDS